MPFIHTSIRTSDMDRSIAFYEKWFGLKFVNRRYIEKIDTEIAFLEDTTNTFRLELARYRPQKEFSQAEYGKRTFDHLGFLIDDIEKIVASMRDAELKVFREPDVLSPGGSTIAYVEDPDGTMIELIQKRKQ